MTLNEFYFLIFVVVVVIDCCPSFCLRGEDTPVLKQEQDLNTLQIRGQEEGFGMPSNSIIAITEIKRHSSILWGLLGKIENKVDKWLASSLLWTQRPVCVCIWCVIFTDAQGDQQSYESVSEGGWNKGFLWGEDEALPQGRDSLHPDVTLSHVQRQKQPRRSHPGMLQGGGLIKIQQGHVQDKRH